MVNCLIVGGHSGDRQRLAERFRRTGVNVGLAKDHPGSEIGDLPDMVILLEDDPGMQDCPVPVIVLESSETSARMYLPREGGLESFVDLMGCMNDPRNQSLGELAGSSHDIIWSIDGEFRFRYVSPSVERILGYRPEELLSRDFTEYLTTECQERLDRLIEDRAERPVELEFLCPSGEGRWLETSIVGSGENSFTGISREISGRKKVERECRKPAELLSATERINGRMMEGRPEKETLQYICDTLQGIEGIRNARAYLLDGEDVHCTASALEGEGELSRMILEGERPHCLQRALDSRGMAIVEEPTETCELCSLEKREGEVALVRRLEHGDRLLGVVSVLTTEDYWKGIGGFRLFEDLADTMALGLYSMELRREKERSEEELRLASLKLNLLGKMTRHDILNQVSVARMALDMLEESTGGSRLMGRIWDSLYHVENQLDFSRDYEIMGKRMTWMVVADAFRSTVADLELGEVRVEIDVGDLEILVDPLMVKVFRNLVENSLRHGGEVTRISLGFEEGRLVYADDGRGIPEGGRSPSSLGGWEGTPGWASTSPRRSSTCPGWGSGRSARKGKGRSSRSPFPPRGAGDGRPILHS